MAKRKPKFTVEELLSPYAHFEANREPSPDTYAKWESMLAVLAKDVDGGKELSHLESQFFAFGAKNCAPYNSYLSHKACKNEEFEMDVLIYSESILNGHYQKPQAGAIVNLTQQEIDALNTRMDEHANEWKSIVDCARHPDQLLQQLCTETRQELTKLRKMHKASEISTQVFEDSKKKAYWKSRTVYLKIGKLLEEYPLVNYQPVLNSTKLDFTEYTLAHIMNRHYIGIFQYAFKEKTTMPRTIDYKKLHIVMHDIIAKINQSGLFSGQDIGKIPFKYRGDDFIIYTATEHHSTKEQKNHTIQRINSFHKVDVPGEVAKLKATYDLKKIDDELSLYTLK